MMRGGLVGWGGVGGEGRMGFGDRGEEISGDISYVLRLRYVRERNTNEELHVSTCQQRCNMTM